MEFFPSILAIDAQEWNTLAAEASPFLRHEFLAALEETGCVTPATGWDPCHALVRDSQGRALAALPLYRKHDSYGEYVFDWSWAEAFHRNGQRYYPKLLSAVPFTPSAGPRLLEGGQPGRPETAQALVEAVRNLARDEELSSWHVLFPLPEESARLADLGLMQRTGCQFHWFNRGYQDFEHFLASMSSRKRKNIRKERAAIAETKLRFDTLPGAEVAAADWRHFHRFYQSTYAARGQRGYLSLQFFLRLAAVMPDKLVLSLVRDGSETIAGALFLRDQGKLYGRYWGCRREYQFLHFETCFYRGIDYSIAHGLGSFDAGAQGEHKIQRGFEPVTTWSNHWIRNEAFATAIRDFLDRERPYIETYREQAAGLLPFRHD